MRAHRYLAWSLAVYGVGFLIVPLQPNIDVTSDSAMLWAGSAAAAVFGLWVACTVGKGKPPLAARRASFSLQLASRRITMLAAIGVVCMLIDRYLLRGAPLTFDILAARDALENTAPSPLGLVAGLLGGMGCFVLGMAVARASGGERLQLREWLACAGVTAAYVGVSIGLGSRSTLLVTVIVTLFCLLWSRRAAGLPLRLRYVLAAVALLVAVAGISAQLMLERLKQMGLDPMLSVEFSGYAYAVSPSPSAYDWMSSHVESFPLAIGAFSLLQYVYHGFFEFSLFAQEPAVSHTGGEATLWLPLKLGAVVMPGLGAIDYESIPGWREGIFTTYLGPLYLDFGALLPLAAFVLFAVLGLPAATLRKGRLEWLPYCAILCAVCVLFPVVNLLDSASGAYPMVGSLVVGWLGREARQRQRVSR